MTCQIDMDFAFVSPDILRYDTRRARHDYVCGECGAVIVKGQQYEVATMFSDREWSRYRTCLTCVRIRNDYFCSWVFGEMRESFENEFGFDYCETEADSE